jgi:hypothetical protein
MTLCNPWKYKNETFDSDAFKSLSEWTHKELVPGIQGLLEARGLQVELQAWTYLNNFLDSNDFKSFSNWVSEKISNVLEDAIAKRFDISVTLPRWQYLDQFSDNETFQELENWISRDLIRTLNNATSAIDRKIIEVQNASRSKTIDLANVPTRQEFEELRDRMSKLEYYVSNLQSQVSTPKRTANPSWLQNPTFWVYAAVSNTIVIIALYILKLWFFT